MKRGARTTIPQQAVSPEEGETTHALEATGRLVNNAARAALVWLVVAGVSGCCRSDPPSPRPGAPARCPEHMSVIGGRFCMDTYEASLVVVAEAGQRDAPHPHQLPVGGLRVRAVSLPGVFPQAFVSQREAKAACEEADKHLCTDEEWTLACEGAEAAARTYPYGEPHRAGACNDAASVSPLTQTFGPRAAGSGYRWDELNDPRLGLVPGALAKTGAHPGCRTPEGVVDLVGNLHEWTDDPGGTFRGGFYLDTRQHGEGCRYVTTAHDVSYRDYSIGFRCCAGTAP